MYNELIDRSLLISVFISSILGSWHCAGMCGPLSIFASHKGKIPYQAGKALGYSTLGVLAGYFGERLLFLNSIIFQAMGVLFLVAVLFLALLSHLNIIKMQMNPLTFKWFKKLQLEKKSSLSIGILTIFIPCGWLWLNITTAASSLDPLNGGLIMFFFWLGTVPALWGVTTVMSRNVLAVKSKYRKYAFMILFCASIASIGGQIWMMQNGTHCKIPQSSPN